MEREGRGGSYYNYGDYDYENGNCNRYRMENVMLGIDGDNQSPEISSSSTILPVSSFPLSPSAIGVSFIEHHVSKMDTLAGIAIKYGVEVADIKRINGLVTDLQMFALRTLQIPLPGRHPPSPCLLNGSETPQQISSRIPTDSVHCNLFETFQSARVKSSSSQRLVSPAMSSLQGYYRLKPEDERDSPKDFEMAGYGKESSAHYLEDGPFSIDASSSNPPPSRVRKCRSVANGFSPENGEAAADNMSILEAKEGDSGLIRRRQRSEADFSRTPEMLLKEDNSNSGCGSFSSITGKCLALRNKAANRTDADASLLMSNPIPVGLGDSIVTDSFGGVRKSSSTSNLQDQDNAGFPSSIWPTSMWNLKPDLQALSTAAITRPIFDGLPKPITGRRNKAALD